MKQWTVKIRNKYKRKEKKKWIQGRISSTTIRAQREMQILGSIWYQNSSYWESEEQNTIKRKSNASREKVEYIFHSKLLGILSLKKSDLDITYRMLVNDSISILIHLVLIN
jgi:hypothetical protein